MRFLKPDFYDNFKCKADKCSFNCCMGWTITIDKDTVNKYNSVEGEFGKKLKENLIDKTINEKTNKIIKLDENNMCPFLTEKGLCEIVLKKGPSYLSDTCREYPRKTIFYADIIEKYMTTSCPAVVEFLYNKKHIEFNLSPSINLHVSFKTDAVNDEKFLYGSDIRRFFIDLLQLEGIPLWTREYFVYKCAENMQPYYDKNDFDAVSKESNRFTDLDYLADYADKLIEIEENYQLKFNFLSNLYLYFGKTKTKVPNKYYDKLSKLNEISADKLQEIYKDFEKIHNDIEYVFENLSVLNLFTEFFSNADLNIYEVCSSVFILGALIKFCMVLYWYTNDMSISKQEQIDIIAILTRNFMHNKAAIKQFCDIQEKNGLFNPSYLFLITR